MEGFQGFRLAACVHYLPDVDEGGDSRISRTQALGYPRPYVWRGDCDRWLVPRVPMVLVTAVQYVSQIGYLVGAD